MAHAEEIKLIAAGSLRAALTEIAGLFSEQVGVDVSTTFGASGLMRERIERGETHHVFASANMAHPTMLYKAGLAGPVRLFASNTVCALAQPGLAVSTENLLETMLTPGIRVGISTPKADPSGDYAFLLFAKANAISPGAGATLEAKALQLTGGEASEKAPDGRNQYGWLMERGVADIFLTYRTNAMLAKRELDELQVIRVPRELSVDADYGLTVIRGAPPEAQLLAEFFLSADAQSVLAHYGFRTVVR